MLLPLVTQVKSVFHQFMFIQFDKQSFTCSKTTMETREQCVKAVQSLQYRHQNDVTDVAVMSLKVHKCRFENLSICLCFYKNNTLKISHS